MKTMNFKNVLRLMMIVLTTAFISCDNDDDSPVFMGDEKVYILNPVADPNISGTATFRMNQDNSATVILELMNTTNLSEPMPAHIHFNTAAEGGGIAASLTPVDPATGTSVTQIDALDDGTSITYTELLNFDGYINVHESMNNLATLYGQGDIGQNELTGQSKSYGLGPVTDPNISGEVIFNERANGTALAELSLIGPVDGIVFESHIHMNSAAEGGGIAFFFNDIDGSISSSSVTQVEALEDGSSFNYNDILTYDGYVNVHLKSDLSVLYAQGDIGQNELTGEMKSYPLGPVSDPNISGEVVFKERNNGTALAELSLNGPIDGIVFESHIHMNSAAEGGGIVLFFNDIDGSMSSSSATQVEALEDGSAFGYDDVLSYDGYVNTHLKSNLSVLYAQGDIGSNELTTNTITYDLNEVSGSMVSGTAVFTERVSGEALLEIMLNGTQMGDSHPSHIHVGSVDNPGAIAVGLNPVNGATGLSVTHISMTESGDAFGFDDVMSFEGYINVHLSADDLATLVAQGNIGSSL